MGPSNSNGYYVLFAHAEVKNAVIGFFIKKYAKLYVSV